jgi:hypothetical protein
VGVRELCVFEGRQRRLEPIGASDRASQSPAASSDAGAR